MAPGEIGRTGFELQRHGGIGGLGEGHGIDHIAPAEKRRHRLRAAHVCHTARRCPSGRRACAPRRHRSRNPKPARRHRRARRPGIRPPRRSAPTACAASMTGRRSGRVPSVFEACVTATMRVLSSTQRRQQFGAQALPRRRRAGRGFPPPCVRRASATARYWSGAPSR